MHYLNLNLVQVCEDHSVLYELDNRLLILNKTLTSNMKVLSHVRYMLSVLPDVQTAVTRITSAVLILREDEDAFYKYMNVLASRDVNLLVAT